MNLVSEDEGPQGLGDEDASGPVGATVLPVAMVALAVVLVVLAGAGLWIAVFSPAAASGPDGDPQPPDPDRVRPATLESAWPIVDARAREWDDEARLVSATVQFDWPADPAADTTAPVGGWLIYVFVRDEGGEPESLSIMVERNRAAIVRETAASLGTDLPAAELTGLLDMPIDSNQALTLAETGGGRAFRAECRAARYVTRLTFQRGSEGTPPVWLLSYNDNRVRNGRAMTITVVATTGEAAITPFTGAIPPLDELGDCPR